VTSKREVVRAAIAVAIALVIFLFNWGAANLGWFGQWVRHP